MQINRRKNKEIANQCTLEKKCKTKTNQIGRET